MLNTPWAEREIFKALQVIAAETETDLGEIIDALTGYAWGEEDREVLRKMIPECEIEEDAPPQPALMICNHAGECGIDCSEKEEHKYNALCPTRVGKNTSFFPDCPFPNSVCVPWAEPVKHYLCDGCHHEYSGIESQRCAACRDFDDINDAGQVYHQFWTPKQPEPVVKENFTAKEPKAEPGLIGCKIVGGKGNELWLVQRPAGAIALYKAVGRKDFAYIETEIGDKFISLQAFDDPPRRAWFRETNITDQ